MSWTTRQDAGNPEQLARDARVLAETAGPEADRPILPTASAAPTDSGAPSSDGRQDEEVLSETEPGRPPGSTPARRERPPRSWGRGLPAWLSWASAALVGGLLAVLAVEFHRPRPPGPVQPWLATPEEVARFAPDAGVGRPKAALPTLRSFGRPMPKGPLKGQRRPPCERGEVAIHGACWVWVGGEEPPCGDTMFDYDGRCFKVSTDAPRQPTSEEP